MEVILRVILIVAGATGVATYFCHWWLFSFQDGKRGIEFFQKYWQYLDPDDRTEILAFIQEKTGREWHPDQTQAESGCEAQSSGCD
jgi:hypothetical protein